MTAPRIPDAGPFPAVTFSIDVERCQSGGPIATPGALIGASGVDRGPTRRVSAPGTRQPTVGRQ